LLAIPLTADEEGVGMLIRRKTRPLAYILHEAPAGTVLTTEVLRSLIAEAAAGKIVEEAIGEELATSPVASAKPSVTAAICTRARTKELARCIGSLLPLQESHGFEILVVDNAPPNQETSALLQKFPTVRYVVEPRPGLDFARNRALAEAGGEWIAFLDDDIVADRWWFDALEDALRENPDAAAITGLVLPLELSTTAQIVFEKRGGFQRGFDPRRYGSVLPGNPVHPCGAGIFGTGSNMAFRRDTLRQLGGFDEALDTGAPLPGGGDLDMFFRIIRAGNILVYEPRFLVFHEHRRDEAALQRQYYTWGLGLMAYVDKHRRADIAYRDRFRRLIRWWFHDQFDRLRSSLRGRHPLPARMVLAEILGGIVGLLGEYGRSRRRIERIRKEFS